MVEAASRGLLRDRKPDQHHRVTFVELFFDLVFVFAVTQLSHRLLAHFSAGELGRTGLLMLSVWWVWMYTCWVTNWLDPDRVQVRLMLFLMMLAGLLLSTSIPKAFETRGLLFSVAYAGMQVGRSVFMLLSIPESDPILRINFARIVCWLAVAAVFWVAGGFTEGASRLWFWAGALAIEYAGPVVRFWTPRLGAARVSDWSVEGGHLAERAALFIIIALGESVLVTGATFAEAPWTASTVASFVVAFTGSVALWWIYFDKGAELGAERISTSSEPGRLGRLAYTYLHLPIVAGIILSAVGDELSLAHPDGEVDTKILISVVDGPLVYLVGVVSFKRTLRGWFQPSHLVGIGLLAALGALARHFSVLGLAAATAAILVLVALWESLSLAATAGSE